MHVTAGTIFRYPANYAEFETSCMRLAEKYFNTPNALKNGRTGQPQKGVDVWGYRNRDMRRPFGVQCKLKTTGADLTEAEVREEWAKALEFRTPIDEFFIWTTANNDVEMDELARELALEHLDATGRSVEFYVWGWQRMCDEIATDANLIKVFDPDWGPYSREHSETLVAVRDDVAELKVGLNNVVTMLARGAATYPMIPSDETTRGSDSDKGLDREIDGYRSVLQAGKPQTALPLFRQMLANVEFTASGHVMFRIKANIGACHLALEEVDKGCAYLLAAYEHAPEEPKAIANRALAFLLQSKFEQVLEIGREEFELDRADVGLWPHVVQAAAQFGFRGDPLSLVPERHRENQGVVVAAVHFHRIAGDRNWRAMAAHAYGLFSDDRYARQFYADSILEQVGEDEDRLSKNVIPSSLKAPLDSAAEIYLSIWQEATKGENAVGHEELVTLANAFVALRLLNRHEEAIELIAKERSHIEKDQDVLVRAVIVAFEAGSHLASDMLPLLDISADAAMLKLQIGLRQADWEKIAEIGDDLVGMVHEPERPVSAAAVAMCKTWTAAGGVPSPEDVVPIIEAAASDARASILVADMCMTFGLRQSADQAWNNGRRSVTPLSHWSSKIGVAKHAFRRHRWRDAADLLIETIDLTEDSEELRQLAVSIACELPQSARGARFFRNLPKTLRENVFFKHYEAVMLFNAGDLPRAEKTARAVLAEVQDLENFKLLTLILRRSGRPEKVKAVVNGNDVLAFEGSPADRAFAAQTLHEVGRVEEALKAMHALYQANRESPDITMAFFGMVLREKSRKVTSSIKAVQLDAYVKLEDDAGHVFNFIVGDDASTKDNVFLPTHAFVQHALGKKVGESFEFERNVGDKVTWTVRELCHRYVHVMREIGDSFETRFPDANGVYSFTMKDEDIQPMLDMVKRQAEANQHLAKQYVDGVPISFVTARIHRDPISFAEYLRSQGEPIRTCIGNGQERELAFKTIELHRASGAVLDSYTAWTAATLGVLPALKTLFGSLYIPHSVKDDVLLFRGFDEPSGRRTLSVSYEEGQFVKHEITRDQVVQRRKLITGYLQEIEKHCEILPVAAPPIEGDGIDARMEILDAAISHFGGGVLDPAALAANGYILLSEDMQYRQWAGAVWPIKGIWLQPALASAVVVGALSFEEYAAKLVELAKLRHDFISVDPVILIETLRRGDDQALADFTAAADFIGTASADLRSHVGVTQRFVDGILVQEDIPYVVRLKAISVLLGKLIRHQAHQYGPILSAVVVGCESEGQGVAAGWIKGHFLLPKVQEAYQEFCQRTLPYSIRSILSGDRSLVGSLGRLQKPRRAKASKVFEQTPEDPAEDK
jgi:cellulose synthase operon protein C